MYELPKPPAEDWLTLIEGAPDGEGGRPPVRVRMAPIGPSALRAARMVLAQPSHPVAAFAADASFDDFCRELVRRAIIAWEGVGQGGAPAPITEETVTALLSDPGILATLQGLYVVPFLEREAEKNVSSLSSAGTSPAKTGAPDTARAAPAGATNAPIPSTRRKRAKPKPAGK